MLKASQKSLYRNLQNYILGLKPFSLQKNAQVIQNSSLQFQKRDITSHYVYLNENPSTKKRTDILDITATYNRHLGYLRLNREHRFNTLTPNYIKNVKRGIETLYNDDNIKLIYLTTEKGEHFCNGTDFRTLLYHKTHNEHEKIAKYLEDLYDLQIFTAKVNKPMIGVAHGHSFNSGATFLQAIGCPMVSHDSDLAFNDVSFGFIPHSGSTYYLSRMPGELGTFLAITGLHMNGVDAVELGFAEKLIDSTKLYEESIMDAFYNLTMPYTDGYALSDEGKIDPWAPLASWQTKLQETQRGMRYVEAATLSHFNVDGGEFAEPKDRKPETNRIAEYKYMNEIDKYNDARFNKNAELEYLGNHVDSVYYNHYQTIIDYVKGYTPQKYDANKSKFKKHLQTIDRCFYSNTIEEIIENLKRENTPFTKLCLEQMDKNSMLSMKLALRLLREAKNLDYKGCLQNEVNVALNKIQDKEFDQGVQEILMKPGRDGTQPQFRKNISNDEVESFFQRNKFTDAIELNVVEKALLPTRMFYQKYSDTLRLWINEETTPQQDVRKGFSYDLKNALRTHGIDIRDRAMTIKDARDHFYEKENSDRIMKIIEERISHFSTDFKLQEIYREKVNTEITRYQNDKPFFYQKVNEHIRDIFEKAYLGKLQKVYDKSKEIHDLDKRRMLIRFKKFLFQSRLLVFSDETDRTIQQIASMPFKEVHLTEEWDKSYLNQEHPDINTSIIHQLSKAVGKVSIAPVELAKHFMQNQSVAKQLTRFTFSKEELQKLRRDVFENPEKYTQILSDFKTPKAVDFPKTTKDIRNEEWDYWFRVFNDGYHPWDNIPNMQFYLDYKNFVDKVDQKAYDTLKYVITRLLNDFDHKEGINEIKDFGPEQKETKRQQLNRLLGLIYETEVPKEPKQLKGRRADKNEIVMQTRSLEDIRRAVDGLIRQDQNLKDFIPELKEGQNNPLISKFRKELLDKLYQTIEFLLLNNNPNYPLDKKVLEERLAAITSPVNGDQATIASLNIIDQFLNDHNAEQVIKHAIQLTKPFFLQMAREELEREVNKVADAFQIDRMAREFIRTYHVLAAHPDIVHSDIFNKMVSYHSDKDKQKYIYEKYPELSPAFEKRNLMNVLGVVHPQKNQSIDQQMKALEQVQRQDEITMKTFKDKEIQKEKGYVEDIQKYRDLTIERSALFNEQNELDLDPQMSLDRFNQHDIELITAMAHRLEYSLNRLDEIIEPLMADSNRFDWMHIINALVKNYDVDILQMFRFNFFQDEMEDIDFTQEMKQLMGRQDATFEQAGEYAGFLRDIHNNMMFRNNDSEREQDFQKVYEFYNNQIKLIDDVQKVSIFDQLLKQKQDFSLKPNTLAEKIKNLTQTQEERQKQKAYIQSVKNLARSIPKEHQDHISTLLASENKYLNYEKIEQILRSKQYEKLHESHSILSKQMLIKDLQDGKMIQNLMKNYLDIKLDVISIAQAKEIVHNTNGNEFITQRVKQQIKSVLEYANESMKHISNDRRKEITLGDYLKRHQFMNTGHQFSKYSNDVIKNLILNTLGQGINPDEVQMVESEIAQIRNNPLLEHVQIEEALDAYVQGKSQDIQRKIDQDLSQESLNAPNFKQKIYFISRINPHTGVKETVEASQASVEDLLVDVKQFVKISVDQGFTQANYQNKILQEYALEQYDELEIEKLIKEYSEIRMKDLMYTPGFKERIQSKFGHYYLQGLKEEIVKELNLDNPAKEADLLYESVMPEPYTIYDPEAKHNLADINNTDAVGYDNIDKRAENPDQNRNLANQSLFDELLSEYFRQKRTQVVNINKLIDDLNAKYTADNRTFKEGSKYYSGDKEQIAQSYNPFAGDENKNAQISLHRLAQIREKGNFGQPMLLASSFTEMMELDINTTRALQGNKNGLSSELRAYDPKNPVKVPEYIEQSADPRQPVDTYVDSRLRTILDEVFEIRGRLEKTLSRNELLAYDKVLVRHLTHESIMPRLENMIVKDFNLIQQMGQAVDREIEGSRHDLQRQIAKEEHNQTEENKKVKNEDALYKLLTYSAMLEKQRNTLRSTDPEKLTEIALDITSFEQFYKYQLENDSQVEPRKIGTEKDYTEPKRPIQEKFVKRFEDIGEHERNYVAEFEKYKENKKETFDRNKTYFVLEKFFEKTKVDIQNKKENEPLTKVQETIVEYFNNPENIEFFERNKIQ